MGVGLAILEQQFIEDTGTESNNPERTSKRRKTSPAQESTASPASLLLGRSNKAKGGIGYAGDQKEDVSNISRRAASGPPPILTPFS